MTDFTGRRVVVMGGSRGIGRATALAFARAGAAIAICARGAETLETTRREIEALGVPAYAAPWTSPTPPPSPASSRTPLRPSAASTSSSTTPAALAVPILRKAGSPRSMSISWPSSAPPPRRFRSWSTPRKAPSSTCPASPPCAPQAQPQLRRHQSRRHPLHRQPGPHPGRPRHPRQRRRARLDRVPRRRLGTPPHRGPGPIRQHSRADPLRPPRPPRGGRRRHPVPRLRRARWVTGQTIVVDGGQLLGP